MKIVYNIIKLEIIYVMNINRIVLFVIMLFLFREKIWEVLFFFSVSKFILFFLKLIIWFWIIFIYKVLLVYEIDFI